MELPGELIIILRERHRWDKRRERGSAALRKCVLHLGLLSLCSRPPLSLTIQVDLTAP